MNLAKIFWSSDGCYMPDSNMPKEEAILYIKYPNKELYVQIRSDIRSYMAK